MAAPAIMEETMTANIIAIKVNVGGTNGSVSGNGCVKRVIVYVVVATRMAATIIMLVMAAMMMS